MLSVEIWYVFVSALRNKQKISFSMQAIAQTGTSLISFV